MGRRRLPTFGLAALVRCWLRLSSCSQRWLETTARPSSLEGRRHPRSRPRRPSHHARCCSETPCARPSTSCSTRSASIPRSVRVAADFSPWEVVGRPERRIASTDEQAHVRWTFVLRCLSGACVPAGQSGLYEFPQGRVSFTRRGDRLDESSIPVRLPAVRVYSRLTDVAACRRLEAVGTVAGGSPLASRTVVSSRSEHARPSAPAGRARRDGRGRRTRVRGLAAGGSRSTSGACALASARTRAESPRAGARPPRERRSGRRRRRSAPRARARRRGAGARGVGRPQACASGTGVGLVGGRSAGQPDHGARCSRSVCARRDARDSPKWRRPCVLGCSVDARGVHPGSTRTTRERFLAPCCGLASCDWVSPPPPSRS